MEIADHLPVFTTVYDPALSPFPDSIEYRNFKKFNIKNFRTDLKKKNWELVLNSNDCNESLSRFLHIFNRVSNKHAPLKTLNIRNKSSKPWVTSGLKKAIKTRDKLYKKWLLTRDLTCYNKYKLYRNKIVSINKYYRELYYNTVLTNSNNTKIMWDNINYIINKKRLNSHILRQVKA